MSEGEQGTLVHDPTTYAAMAQPFDSMDAAHDAMGGFEAAVREARKKHGIRDIYVIINDTAVGLHGDGSAGQFMVSFAMGDSRAMLPLVAWAFGKEQAEHDAMIRELAAGKRTKTVRP